MKKYNQLILISLTVLSVLGAVYYKTEHDKLYHILQVLESFGPSYSSLEEQCKAIKEVVKNHKELPHEDDQWFSNSLQFTEWTTLNNEISVYSAYWDEVRKEILLLCLLESTENLNGKIWLETKNGIRSYDFSEARVLELYYDSESTQKAAVYYVEFKESGIPFKIDLCQLEGEKHQCVSTVIVSLMQAKTLKSTGICVLPKNDFNEWRSIHEFLSFHSNLGVRHFVIYDRYLSVSAQKVLHAAEHLMMEIIVKKWSLPNSLAATKIAELDCLLTLYNFVDNAVLLDLFSYLVPVIHSSIRGFLTDTEVISMEGNRVLLRNLFVCKDSFNSLMEYYGKTNIRIPNNLNETYSDSPLYYGIHGRNLNTWVKDIHENRFRKLNFDNLHGVVLSTLNCDYPIGTSKKNLALSVLSKIHKYIKSSSLYSKRIIS